MPDLDWMHRMFIGEDAETIDAALAALDTIIPASDERAGKISSFRGFLLLERQKHSEQGSLF